MEKVEITRREFSTLTALAGLSLAAACAGESTRPADAMSGDGPALSDAPPGDSSRFDAPASDFALADQGPVDARSEDVALPPCVGAYGCGPYGAGAYGG